MSQFNLILASRLASHFTNRPQIVDKFGESLLTASYWAQLTLDHAQLSHTDLKLLTVKAEVNLT